MKTIVLLIILYFPLTVKSQRYFKENNLIPHIDPRIELLNILYFLAKHPADLELIHPTYFKHVSNYFKKYTNHACVQYVSKEIEKFQQDSLDIKDWELPSLALHLTPQFDLFSDLAEPNQDGWDDLSIFTPEFIDLIKDFYKDTHAKRFFKSQQPYFRLVQNTFKQAGLFMDGRWVSDFFGIRPSEKYYPILGLIPTPGAYLRVNFKNHGRYTHTLFSSNQYDAQGIPQVIDTQYYQWAMLHETIHCFSNQFIDHDTTYWKPLGNKLLQNQEVKNKVQHTFYNNWRYILYEYLVRAAEIQYAKYHGAPKHKIRDDLNKQKMLGFVDLEKWVNALEFYTQHRDTFKNINSFKDRLYDCIQ